MSRLEGGEGRGWPFLSTTVSWGLFGYGGFLFYQAVWVYINGSVFGIQGRVLLGAVSIYPRSSSRSEAEISQMFSHMQHDVSEALSDSQHMILVGDFNAHFDNLPDYFPEGHVAMLSRFPELDTTRLGQYKGPS